MILMWFGFAAVVLVCLLLVFLPGALFFRGLGFDLLKAVTLAPIASVTGYLLASAVFCAMGIPCSASIVFSPVLITCMIVFSVRISREHRVCSPPRCVARARWMTLALYLVVGIAVGIYMFASTLETPSSFLQEYDNAFHMNVTCAFVDSGVWNPLSVSKYLTPEDVALAPLGGGSFYPALWHILCALVTDACVTSVACAINAVNFVVSSIVYPLGTLFLLTTIFRSRHIVCIGALCALAFFGYPWLIMLWGPLFPNVFAYAFVPLEAALFIRIVESFVHHEKRRKELIAFCLGFAVLTFSQPNALFYCVVFLSPFCFYRLWTHARGIPIRGRRVSGKAMAFLFVVFVLVVWTALFYAPFMHATVFNAEWSPLFTKDEAFYDVITLGLENWRPQYALAVAVGIGALWTLRERRFLWITVAYLLFCIMYFACAAGDGFMRRFLTGFWYVDSYRIAACVAVAGVPLATMGVFAVLEYVHGFFSRRPYVARLCIALLLVAFCAAAYAPRLYFEGEWKSSTLEQVREGFLNNHRHVGVLLDADEQAFLDEVARVVPEGELIINMPDDGSGYAYPSAGIRTYYRDYRVYAGSSSDTGKSPVFETTQSRIIRERLAQVATDQSVQEALRDIGARYVVVLDQGESFKEQRKLVTYEEALWTGIAAIADDTPGFRKVLGQGDMRLYEILVPEKG